jgi:lipopolysaccharide/colanic/teichoic acid biosynthesis glycosyltransferase
MPKGQRRLLIFALMTLDALAVALAVVLADWWVSVQKGGPHGARSLPLVLGITIPAAIGLFALNRLYLLDELLEGPVEYGRVVYGCTLMAFSLGIFDFWGRGLADAGPSRRFVAILWLLSLLAVGADRFMARRIVRALRRRGHLMSRALIVGLGALGISIAHHFRDVKNAGIQVVGFIDDFLPPGTPVTDGLKVLGPPSALPRILQETGASEMIVVPTAMAWESFQDLIRSASNLNGHAIRMAPGFRDILATNVRVHQFGLLPLLTIERVRITGLDAVLKRIMDYGTAILLTPLALPVIGVSALALARAGIPPFRTVHVIGRGGMAFSTHLLNTGDLSHGVQRLIHHLGVDCLPQLFNVFRGEMSIVGPRPVICDQRHHYERWIPNLLTVKPGITGPWALRPPQSLEDEMQLNLFYIRNYSIWLDLEIAARFLRRMVRRPTPGGQERPSQQAAEMEEGIPPLGGRGPMMVDPEGKRLWTPSK